MKDFEKEMTNFLEIEIKAKKIIFPHGPFNPG